MFLQYLDPLFLLQTLGIIGVACCIFAESGLFIGFFLPGDSLLVTAGVFASQGFINIWVLIVAAIVAAILGDSVGYSFGSKMGSSLFTKKSSRLFNPKNVHKAKDFYEKHGNKTIIMARFIPIVRTFVPIVAGVVKMNYKTFLTNNIVGGVLWVVLITMIGYLLGNAIPNIDHYIIPLVVVVVVFSLLPGIYEIYKQKIKF